MARYRNGFVPKSQLIHTAGEHWFTPGTLQKWENLIADVKRNEGVTLYVTSGPNAYRDYAAQVEAKREHGKNAAYPGTSSHGGVFEGRDSMAIDCANWMQIGKNKFYAYARKHGFEPGYFSWEPWHIIDWDPWRAVTPPTPTPTPEPLPIPLPEGKTMADVKQIHWVTSSGAIGGRALIIPGTAWALPFTESGSTYANRAATQFETGSSVEYTKSLYDAFISAAARVAPTALTIETVNAE